MPIMIIDTETSGLMDFKRPAEAEGQPRVCEFAAVTLKEDLTADEHFQCYIQRDGWEMSPEITKINGITNEMLDQHGIPIKQALDFYADKILTGYTVLAFNAQFDCKMMRSELHRAGRQKLFYETMNACMMRDARPFAKSIGRHIEKLPKEDGTPVSQGGFPKLSDLCAFLGVETLPKHNALDDCVITHRCFLKLVELGYEPDFRVHESKNHEAIRSAL